MISRGARLPALSIQIYKLNCFSAIWNRWVFRRDLKTGTLIEVTTVWWRLFQTAEAATRKERLATTVRTRGWTNFGVSVGRITFVNSCDWLANSWDVLEMTERRMSGHSRPGSIFCVALQPFINLKFVLLKYSIITVLQLHIQQRNTLCTFLTEFLRNLPIRHHQFEK